MTDISYTSPYPSGWVSTTATPFNATVGATFDAGIVAATTQANLAMSTVRAAVVAAGGTPPPYTAISYTSPYPSGWVNNTVTPWSARVGRVFDAGIRAATEQANAALAAATNFASGTGGGGTGGGGGTFTVGTTEPTAATNGLQVTSPPVHEGDIIVTTAGTVIENLLVRGGIDLRAPNCRLTNVKAVGRDYTAYPGFDALIHASASATNTVIEFCEASMYDDTLSHDNWVGSTGYHAYFMVGIKVVGGSGTIRRVNVHDTNHLIELGGGTWVVEAPYLHDPSLRTDDADHMYTGATPYGWSHPDGIHISGGVNHQILGPAVDMKFSTLTGSNSAANPNPLADPYWPNAHGILARSASNPITGLVVKQGWFRHGAAAIHFTNSTYTGGTATLDGNRFTPNQSREFSAYTQILIDPTTSWAVTDAGTNVYSGDPDTPSAWRGVALKAPTTGGSTKAWRFASSYTGSLPVT